MSASVHTALADPVRDQPVAAQLPVFQTPGYRRWEQAMSHRLAKWVPDTQQRLMLLRTVHYEAMRAGLDAQLVLSIIEVESGFRKYAVSSAGARGYMQIMPFWHELIGADTGESNLFHLRTNLRYGCTVLRHYLDIEEGNLLRALGRYNGAPGALRYPNKVRRAWTNNWAYDASSSGQDSPELPAHP